MDTIVIPDVTRELSKLPTEAIAEGILSDRIIPRDDELTYRCIDSLNTKSSELRFFYFKVFTKILSKADGAVAEAAAEKSVHYVEHNPKLFASYMLLSPGDLKIWGESLASEISLENEKNSIPKMNQWIKNLIKNCSDCDNEDVKILHDLNKQMVTHVVTY